MKVNNDEFLKLISDKKNTILQRTADGVTNTDSFRKLRLILESFKSCSPIPVFCILIEEEHLYNLNFDKIKSNLRGSISQKLQTENHIIVDNEFNALESYTLYSKDSSEAQRTYIKTSQNRICVLFISEAGIHYFFDGHSEGNTIFFTEYDIKTYYRKKDISEIFDVLKEYKERLKQQHVYSKFFVHKTSLIRIFREENYIDNKNLLRNKPEQIFRDDLRAFLSDKIRATFNISKEYQLDSNKRIDINTEDDVGNYYFLEIKWMGISINPADTAPQTSYGENHIKKGVSQTLKYIKELKDSKKTVKLGCLTVFDARDSKDEIKFEPYDYIENGLDEHLPNFRPVADLYITNEKPI